MGRTWVPCPRSSRPDPPTVNAMERTGQLLALLASTDRRRLLSTIAEEPLRASQLAARLSLTVQETARQLTRLQAAGLVEKDGRSLLRPTSSGTLAISLLPSFDFLALHTEFVRSHDFSSLPPEFCSRIGELVHGEAGNELAEILEHFESVVDDARDHVWLMADQILMQDMVTHQVLAPDAVVWRILMPTRVARLEGIRDLPPEFRGKIEIGLVETVRVGLALNESLAGVVFPDRRGKLDFGAGLRGRDPDFRRWCTDLFQWYWSRARRLG